MARKTTSKKGDPSFEDALHTLEGLVEAMENDQLPLEELVSHYEQGAKLLRHCEFVLDSAKKRIELIEISPSEENGLESDPPEDDDPGTVPQSRDGAESDDIPLF